MNFFVHFCSQALQANYEQVLNECEDGRLHFLLLYSGLVMFYVLRANLFPA